MSDLISRSAVCDMLHDEMGAWGNCADEIEALLKANDALFKIPAVDAIEVCRCKDCKFFVPFVEPYNEAGQCNRKAIGLLAGNDFCSYGERRGHDGTK